MKYVVKKGDYLAKIAAAHGLDQDAVWNDPANATLKATRNPNVLSVGDLVSLPDSGPEPASLTREGSNQYVAAVPEVNVEVRLVRDGNVLANEPFAIESPGRQTVGSSDSDGVARFTTSVHVDRVRLQLPRQGLELMLRVGHLQGIDRPSGQRARLSNLGCMGILFGEDATMAREANDATCLQDAVREFQRLHGLPVTGVADDATRAAILAAHGV